MDIPLINIKNIINKKGYINDSDIKMILFELEMNKKVPNYLNKFLTITPITKNSNKNYIEQVQRIKEGYHHIWTDCKNNISEKGNYFGYVFNTTKKDKIGKIIIYEILEILDPKYSIDTWNNKERNVLLLSSKPLYEGSLIDLFKILEYSEKIQI